MEMLVNTVRMLEHDQVKEYFFGDDASLKDNLALAILNPQDFKKMNLTPRLNLRITSKFGNVVLQVKQDEDVPLGTITIPVSIWANQITGIENNELVFKNINARVEATGDQVMDVKEILKSIKKN
jgi:formylmethanofuran dehydrogenase subunit D